MNRFRLHLALLLVLVLGLALGLVALQSMATARRLLQPEIGRKAEIIAQSTGALIERALDDGIPLRQLVGVRALFATIVNDNRELAFAALVDHGGQVLAAYGPRPALATAPAPGFDAGAGIATWPVMHAGRLVARLDIGIDPAFVQATFRDLGLDSVIIALVTSLIALELSALAFGGRLDRAITALQQRLTALHRADLRRHPAAPIGAEFSAASTRIDGWLEDLHQRYERLRAAAGRSGNRLAGDALKQLERRFGLGRRQPPVPGQAATIRAPLFLFMLAEELSRPFLPGYIKQLATPVGGLPAELVISLPIALFMAIVALLQAPLGPWTERHGRGRSFALGALLGLAGFAGTAGATNLALLLVWRALTAVGFALVFVAAQGQVIDTTRGAQRSRGLAVFIAAIMVAALCGPPIGGMLADRLGSRATFLVAAALAGASLLLAWRTLPRPPVGGTPRSTPFRLTDLRRIGASPALLILLFGCALPAKMILTSVCFFLLPLHLQTSGFDQATIGRLQMLYPLAMVVLVTPCAHLAERWRARPWFVVAGGLLAALATLYTLAAGSLWLVAGLLLQLGIAQALSIASQSALVGELGHRLPQPVNESALYGVFRLIERSGSALGPALAGLLLARYGFATSVAVIGAVVAAGALLFLLLLVRQRLPAVPFPSTESGA